MIHLSIWIFDLESWIFTRRPIFRQKIDLFIHFHILSCKIFGRLQESLDSKIANIISKINITYGQYIQTHPWNN